MERRLKSPEEIESKKRMRQREKSKKSKEDKLNQNKKIINEDIETTKAMMKIADDLLKSGQSAIEEVIKMKTVKKVKLLASQ